MKVKLTKPQVFGSRVHEAGQTVERSETEAKQLISQGLAVPETEQTPVETADEPDAPEHGQPKRTRKKGKRTTQ